MDTDKHGLFSGTGVFTAEGAENTEVLSHGFHGFTLIVGFTGAILKTAEWPSQKLLMMQAPGELTIFYLLPAFAGTSIDYCS